jgi:uncharacterized protein YbcV (DUF1398 family)
MNLKSSIMFTIDQIDDAHSKVKSGADFPNYIQDLIELGVTGFETFVADGHTVYFGKNETEIQSDAKYAVLKIADESDKSQFQEDLKDHQLGKTSYQTFCLDCAWSGIEKWVIDTTKMTCIYYDKGGNEILAEAIPMPE